MNLLAKYNQVNLPKKYHSNSKRIKLGIIRIINYLKAKLEMLLGIGEIIQKHLFSKRKL